MDKFNWSTEEIAQLNREFESKPPEALLGWALRHFHPQVALASSFGAEDVVLVDLLWRLNPQARVFTLDTLRLNTETYEVIDRVRQRYGISLEIYAPDTAKALQMAREHGYNLFYQSVELRQLCCRVRKVEPLERALNGLQAGLPACAGSRG